ncbi:MAG: cobyric acid synthase CobQ, partial [Clostridia bacterium]|nr:cobyric acid synthase CobQ [Clostridia bacterium]
CGGYQMMGNAVSDPDGVETEKGTTIKGLGLLNMNTVFHGEKVQTQTRGVFRDIEGMLSSLNGMAYEGYEIHMGRSEETLRPVEGDGNIYGSYIHGLFDAPGIADEVLRAVCRQRNLDFSRLGAFDSAAYRERQYDLLADAVRAGLDMDFIYRLVKRK